MQADILRLVKTSFGGARFWWKMRKGEAKRDCTQGCPSPVEENPEGDIRTMRRRFGVGALPGRFSVPVMFALTLFMGCSGEKAEDAEAPSATEAQVVCDKFELVTNLSRLS